MADEASELGARGEETELVARLLHRALDEIGEVEGHPLGAIARRAHERHLDDAVRRPAEESHDGDSDHNDRDGQSPAERMARGCVNAALQENAGRHAAAARGPVATAYCPVAPFAPLTATLMSAFVQQHPEPPPPLPE